MARKKKIGVETKSWDELLEERGGSNATTSQPVGVETNSWDSIISQRKEIGRSMPVVQNNTSKYAQAVQDNFGSKIPSKQERALSDYNRLNNSQKAILDKRENRNVFEKAIDAISNSEFSKQLQRNAYNAVGDIEGAKSVDENMKKSNKTYSALHKTGMSDSDIDYYMENYGTMKEYSDTDKYYKKRSAALSKIDTDTYKQLNEYNQAEQVGTSLSLAGTPSQAQTNALHERYQKRDEILKKTGWSVDEFEKNAQYVREVENKNANAKNVADSRKMAKDSVGSSVAANALTIPLNAIGGVMAGAEKINSLFYADKDAPVDTNSILYQPQNMSDEIRNTTAEELENATSNKAVNAVLKYGYQGGMAAADSALLTAGISAGLGDLGVGAEAAQHITAGLVDADFFVAGYAKGLKQANDEGLGGKKANQYAIAQGLNEAVSEIISLDMLAGMFAKGGKTALVDGIKSVLKQAGIEGSEEVFGDILNTMADNYINNDFSDYNQSIYEYKESGMNEEQAKSQARKDKLTEMRDDFITGAIAGGLGAGSAHVMTRKAYTGIGEKVNQDKSQVAKIVEAVKGAKALEGTTAKQIFENKDVENISDADLGRAIQSMQEVAGNEVREVFTSELESKGLSKGNASEVASKLADFVEGNNKSINVTNENKEAVSEVLQDFADHKLDKQLVVNTAIREVGNTLSAEEYKKQASELRNSEKYAAESMAMKYAKQAPVKVAGNDARINSIASTGSNARVKLNNGKTVSLDQVEFESPKMQELYSAASSMENVNVANSMLEYASGIPVETMREAGKQFYDAGKLNLGYEDVLNNPKNAKFTALFKGEAEEAFLKQVYMQGQNASEELKPTPKADTSNLKKNAKFKNKSSEKYSKEQEQFFSAVAKLVKNDITVEDFLKDNAGHINKDILGEHKKGQIGLASKKNNNIVVTTFHEAMENLEVANPQAYRDLKKEVMSTLQSNMGMELLNENIKSYQKAYQKVEGNKSLEDASNELFNDIIGQMFTTKQGVEAIVNETVNDSELSAPRKQGVLENVKDIASKMIKAIKGLMKSKGQASWVHRYISEKEAADIVNKAMAAFKNTGAEGSGLIKNDESEQKHSIYITDEEIQDYLKTGNRANKKKTAAYNNGEQIVIHNYKELSEFVSEAVKGNRNNVVAYGKVDDKLADKILNKSNGRINIKNYYLELNGYDLYHAFRNHEFAKRSDNIDMPLEDLLYAIENINNASVLETKTFADNNKTEVQLEVNTETGTVLLIELVSKSRASIIFKNAWEYKKRSGSNTRGDINLDTLLDEDTSSNSSITSELENASVQQKKDIEKHSINVDSEGRTLTEDQQKYFANSKIRDKQGRLKVMYHGTERAAFTVFDAEHADDGVGLFFTDKEKVAKGYSGTEKKFKYKYTLDDLNRMVDSDEKIVRSNDVYQLQNYDATRDKTSVEFEGTFDEIKDYVLDMYGTVESGNYEVYLNATNPLIVDAKGENWDNLSHGDETWTTRQYASYAKENGYDSLIVNDVIDTALYASNMEKYEASQVVVIFDSNQVKSVDNEHPTNNEDIRYSVDVDNGHSNGYNNLTQFIDFANYQDTLNFYMDSAEIMHRDGKISDEEYELLRKQGREKRKHLMKQASDAKFSLDVPVEATKDLIAVHNMTADELLGTIELGGFPSPSIAIIKAGMEHSKYGDTSVVFYRDTIDPKKSVKNKVYGGDAWTPTFPSIAYKVNDEKLKEVISKLKELVGDNLDIFGYPGFDSDQVATALESGKGSLVNSRYADMPIVKLAYLKDKGIDVEFKYKEQQLSNKLDNKQLRILNNYFHKPEYLQAIANDYNYGNEHPEELNEIRERINDIVSSTYEDEINRMMQKYEETGRVLYKNRAESYKNWFTEDNFRSYDLYDLSHALLKYREEGLKKVVDIYETRDYINELMEDNQDGYEEWINNLYDGLIEKTGIWNGKDPFTASGNRRSWEALHDPVTLENIVKAMNNEEAKGDALFSEMGIKAIATKDFESIADIHAHENQLMEMDEEDYEKLLAEHFERYSEIVNEIMSKDADNEFIERGRISDIIADTIRTRKSVSGIDRELRKWIPGIKDDTAQKLVDLMEDISLMPYGYFEAKPQRAVYLDEIAKVILPDNVSKDIVEELDNNKVPYEMYKAGNEQDRLEKLNEQEDARFSVEINNNLSSEENEYIIDELFARNNSKANTTFETKDGKIGIRNNRSIYIVEEMNDTDDVYRPVRIYDVDFNEGDSTYTSLVLKEIEKNEEEGRTVTKYLSQAYLAYCGNVREGNYIRFYDFDNFRRNTEVKYGKNGNVLSTTIRTTRNRKNGSRNFAQRDSYTRFSIAVDSEGHELSQGQQDFFKDSKIRDEKGRLKVMYHGTSEYGFTVFDKKKAKSSGYYGKGFYFSDADSHAGQYGKQYKVFLNITNPFKAGDHNITKEQLKAFVEVVAEGEDYGIENYGYDATVNSVTDNIWSHEDDFSMIQDVNAACIGDFVEAIKLFNRINNTNYDGIVVPTETVAFEPNQIKLVSNENPTENDDIRYSLSVDQDDIWMDIMEQADSEYVAKTSAIIEEGNRLLQDGTVKITKMDAKRVAADIIDKYQSNANQEELAENIRKVFAYAKENPLSPRDFASIMQAVAMPVVSELKFVDDSMEQEYKNFKKFFKGMKIKLDAPQKAEVANYFDSYNEYRKVMQKYGIVLNLNVGTSLDDVWSEIVEASGNRLSEAENSANQPIALLDYLKDIEDRTIVKSFERSAKDAPVYEGATKEEAAYGVAMDIIGNYYKYVAGEKLETDEATKYIKLNNDLQALARKEKARGEREFKKAVAEAAQEELGKKLARVKHIEAEIAEAKAKRGEAISSMDELTRLAYEELIRTDSEKVAAIRKQKNDEIARIKAKQRRTKENDRARRKTSELKKKVERNYNTLSSMVANPTETKHIPFGVGTENMVNAVIDVLELINLNKGNGSRTFADKMAKLQEKYDALKDNAGFDYDANTASMIATLKNAVLEEFSDSPKMVRELRDDELQTILDITNQLITQIRNENKLINNKKTQDAYEASTGIIEETKKSRVRRNPMTELAEKILGTKTVSKVQDAANKYFTWHLNAERWFNKVSGYKKDGFWKSIYQSLDDGQLKMLAIERDINKIFESVLEGKENQKDVARLHSTKAEDMVDIGLKDDDGKPVMVTRAMRLALIMHSYNEDNLRHVLGDGLTIPDMELYEKGKITDAYNQGKTYRYIPYDDYLMVYKTEGDQRYAAMRQLKLKITSAKHDIENLEKSDDFTEYEKRFLASAKKMFHEYTGGVINDTSQVLKGYKIARVKNYFPIKSDPNFTKQDYAGLVRDGSIEGMGFLKNRVASKNPILLEDITNVILRQTNNTALYGGMAIPIRNLNMVLNITSHDNNGYNQSVKSALAQTWGETDNRFLKNLITDLQMGRHQDPTIFDSMRSKFAGATLTLNLGVAIKQAASYPTAAAVVGWKPLGKAFADFGKGFIKAEGIEELEKRNPLLWKRSQGYSTQELGDIKDNRGWGEKITSKIPGANMIQFVDTGTVRTLEYAAMYYVDEQFKDLEKGSDEYWDKVSEVFTQIVQRTQPNYTTLQRPDMLRTPNQLIKQLAMFKTQPLQNFGIMYDAMAEYGARVSDERIEKSEASTLARKEAGKNLAKAVSSQVVAAAVFSLMTIAADMVYHKQYKYMPDDDEDKTMLDKMLEAFFKGLGSTFSGMLFLGDTLYSALSYWLTGDTYYGLEVSVTGMINDIVDGVANLQSSINKLNEANTDEEAEKAQKKVMQQAKKIFTTAGEFAGIPANNIIKTFDSIVLYGKDIATGSAPGTSEEWIYSETDSMKDRYLDAYNENDQKEMNRIKEQIAEDKDKTEEEATKYVNNWVTSEEWDKVETEVDKVLAGKASSNKAVVASVSEIYSTKKSVSDEKSAKSSVSSSITSKYKNKYLELLKTDKTKAAKLQNVIISMYMAIGYTKADAMKKIKNWTK